MKKTVTILALLFVQTIFAMGSEFEDKLADILTWVIIIILPIGGIYIFWKAHIYPEVVAEKKHHPQLDAIKTMCLLSLFVGGLLWPIALIWANYNYSKPEVVPSTEEENLQIENLSEENVEQDDINLET